MDASLSESNKDSPTPISHLHEQIKDTHSTFEFKNKIQWYCMLLWAALCLLRGDMMWLEGGEPPGRRSYSRRWWVDSRCSGTSYLHTCSTNTKDHNYGISRQNDLSMETQEEFLMQLTRQCLRDVVQADLRFVPQQRVHRHHHSRCAEAALRAVSLGNALLLTQRPGHVRRTV